MIECPPDDPLRVPEHPVFGGGFTVTAQYTNSVEDKLAMSQLPPLEEPAGHGVELIENYGQAQEAVEYIKATCNRRSRDPCPHTLLDMIIGFDTESEPLDMYVKEKTIGYRYGSRGGQMAVVQVRFQRRNVASMNRAAIHVHT